MTFLFEALWDTGASSATQVSWISYRVRSRRIPLAQKVWSCDPTLHHTLACDRTSSIPNKMCGGPECPLEIDPRSLNGIVSLSLFILRARETIKNVDQE